MNPNRILSDELSFELKIRGVPDDGTVAEKRSRLRGILRLEKLQISPFTVSPSVIDELDPPAELGICAGKLAELTKACERIQGDNAANEGKRILSRVLHVLGRLKHIPCATEELSGERDRLRLAATYIVSSLDDDALQLPGPSASRNLQQSLIDIPNELLPEVAHTSAQPTQAPLVDVADVATTEKNPDSIDKYLDDTFTRRIRDISLQAARSSLVPDPPSVIRTSNISSLPLPTPDNLCRVFDTVTKWKITFDGQQSVTTFLERVEELRFACGISKSQLLVCATILFSGSALCWYRATKDSHHSWDILCENLRRAFLPDSYDDEIWSDIRNRTQGEYEKVAIYISVMENLFSKLSHKPKEATRVNIISHNLLPYLQTHLIRQSFRTIPELTTACVECENVYLRTRKFRPPPANPNLVTEPDLMYRKPRTTSAVAAAEIQPAEPSVASPGPSRVSTNAKCWNCRQQGHTHRQCSSPRSKFCFKCGEPSVTVRNCPRCSGNALAERVTEPRPSTSEMSR